MFTEQKLGEKGEILADYNELGEEINSYEYVAGTGIVSTVADKQGNKTAYGYDTKNGTLLQMSSDVDGISNTNTYGYTLGFLTKVSHNDFDITYDYDSRGRVSKIMVAGSDYLTYTYDDANNKTIVSNAKSEQFSTVTDNLGNVISQYYKASETDLNYTISEKVYDTHGNLMQSSDLLNNSYNKYTYDKFGNIIKTETTQNAATCTAEVEFDNFGNTTKTNFKINASNLMHNYEYTDTPDKTLKTIILPFGNTQKVQFDNLERLKNITLNCINEENETKTLDKTFYYLKNGDHTSNQVSSIWFGDSDKYLDNLKYKYDEKGNITEVYENSILQARYKYDSLSRLIREDNKTLNKTTTWEYDAGGNIQNRFEYEFTTAQDLSNLSPTIIPYSYSTSGIRDKLVEYNGEQFEYDGIGNPTTYRNYELTWERGRLLKKFGNIAEYKYNLDGIRTSKTVGTTTTQYFLDGTKIVSQQDTITTGGLNIDNIMYFEYGVDGVAGFYLNGINYYYKKNLQGDIVAIYDNDLNEIVKYNYDAWGNHNIKFVNSNGDLVDFDANITYNTDIETNLYVALKNPFRYRGYYYDFETGLYYLNSRYYDPEIGRFINIDDIDVIDSIKEFTNGINLYAYCLDNPVNDTDSNGNLSWWQWLLVGIGALIVVAAVAVVAVAASGVALGVAGTVALGAAKGALIGAAVGTTIGAIGGGIYSAVTGADFWSSVAAGAAMGFGIGAVVGAVIGGFSAYLSYVPTKITGFTRHGLNQIISRNGHGVSDKAIIDTFKNSISITKQGFIKRSYKFVGQNSVVVLNKYGKLITAWAKKSIGWRF